MVKQLCQVLMESADFARDQGEFERGERLESQAQTAALVSVALNSERIAFALEAILNRMGEMSNQYGELDVCVHDRT